MRTRFAPSPTGPLHLGHAFSALTAFDLATKNGGAFVLRIEDIDQSRARPEWEQQIFDDLHWLGLNWEQPVLRQSDNLHAYDEALRRLWDMGVIFPCQCTRRDIRDALSAPQEGVAGPHGPDGPIYPGTCRAACRTGPMPHGPALRLDMTRAVKIIGTKTGAQKLSFAEANPRLSSAAVIPLADLPDTIGDIVVARRDFGTSYHLSVVVDDAAQQISHVVRGEDLFEATQIHLVLQTLLSLPTPHYLHHELIRDDAGKRLAKRDDARALSKYRAEGRRPEDIRHMVGLD